MGGLAEAAIREVDALPRPARPRRRAKVVDDDKKLDALEAEIERRAVQIIALRAPMAGDLREVVAALKISGVVERIGDYAKNIAKRVPLLENVGTIEAVVAASRDGADRDRDGPRRAQRLRRARCRGCGAGGRTRPRGRRFLQQHLPHVADLHDGKSEQHQPVDPFAVHRQEPRADRRPCHQRRRNGLLSPPPASTSPTARAAHDRDGESHGSKRLLLVEDDRALAELRHLAFRARGL